MKVLGYVRVSTINQQNDGVSQAAQQERIASWARANGHELGGMYVETGSGGRADNRPVLQRLMAAAGKGTIVAVYSLSRLSRSVRDTIDLCERLDKRGAHLASLSESLDTSTAAGRVFFVILAAFAAFEREALVEKTRDALAHMRRNNKRISLRIPFGYSLASDGTTLIPDAEGQAVILRMVQRRAEGMTLAAIAESLTTEGVSTRHGGKWYPATVAAILNRHEKLAA